MKLALLNDGAVAKITDMSGLPADIVSVGHEKVAGFRDNLLE